LCVGIWRKLGRSFLPLVEFTYNNSYQTITGMASYEALYGMGGNAAPWSVGMKWGKGNY